MNLFLGVSGFHDKIVLFMQRNLQFFLEESQYINSKTEMLIPHADCHLYSPMSPGELIAMSPVTIFVSPSVVCQKPHVAF